MSVVDAIVLEQNAIRADGNTGDRHSCRGGLRGLVDIVVIPEQNGRVFAGARRECVDIRLLPYTCVYESVERNSACALSFNAIARHHSKHPKDV